jgi:hypothetical protein
MQALIYGAKVNQVKRVEEEQSMMERVSTEVEERMVYKRAGDVVGKVMVRCKKLRCGVPPAFASQPHRCHHTSDHTLFSLTNCSHCLLFACNMKLNTTTQST